MLNQGRRLPTLMFFLVAMIVLGAAAWISAYNITLQGPEKDIWQHAAALRALIADLANPENPFVVSPEPSRHFHPLWVAWAVFAQAFGLTEWQVLQLAGYVSMATLGAGIFFFARAYHPSPWAPLVLLVALVFGWVVPIEHTGFQSFVTLLYGAAYPATYLIGFSLVLWALMIRSLTQPVFGVLVALLSALMFATHQLGAAIGFVPAVCFALAWPGGTTKARVLALAVLAAGLGLAMLWPYFNPVGLMLQPGNATWTNGPAFYSPIYLAAAFTPSALGLLGLRDRRARPLVMALVIYLCIFLVGFTGFQLSGRFLMPITLVLQIGLASALIERKGLPFRSALGIIFVGCLVYSFSTTLTALRNRSSVNNLFADAQSLTQDIPDDREVSAYDLTAWPVVAVGQRVLSVPWPEPGIGNLADRQSVTVRLFDPDLSREDRLRIAKAAGIRTLFVDTRFLAEETLILLRDQSLRSEVSGGLLRLDLF